ncbi:acyl-CoA thioester hydrolase [Blastococcus sp. DSM 46786]|uniref:acyl-CoA thioesterase n=1 Tax=Blastococcus sp. DSM 46786 TaxID=1798227 RepID=UPI0008AC462B|nr:thioesterase family protein [Blastococcus sp. DSM 46786]SEM05734.1 acyl-CoA thioester hydrolase [Blastococcus sp. DSM 46786]
MTELVEQTEHEVEHCATVERAAFLWRAPVYFDDLDAMGMLHNARYFALTDRAISAYFESLGRRWELDPHRNPDQHWAVREQQLTYAAPFRGVGLLDVELAVIRVGVTSAVYAVRFTTDGVEHARGSRVVIKVDPDTGRPAPWTPSTRAALTALMVPGVGAPAAGGPA